MKKGFLMMLLMGGVALTASAQRGYGRGWGHGRDRCDDRRVVYYERGYRDCRPPARVVYYPRPRYYPVPAVVAVPVPVPPPPPPVVHYYPARPRVVLHAGITVAN